MELEALRKEIDSLDKIILETLNKRMEVVHQVGLLKKNTGQTIYRPEREKEIIDRMKSINAGRLTDTAIEAIFLEIFATSRNLELPEKVAFLGPEGSFTHQAAESRYGALSAYKPLSSIEAVFEEVNRDWARFGVIPIENNQEGVVVETMDLLGKHKLNIVAEVPLSIHFCLASKSLDTRNIKRIYSKDMGLRQCKNYIAKHFPAGIEQIPVESTSKAALLALEDDASAAICAEFAAKQYALPVLDLSIEDAAQNHQTRFVIIAKDYHNKPSGNDKTSLVVKIPDSESPGALVRFLQNFELENINLTKIESRPAKEGDLFSYLFFIDFDGHFEDDAFQRIYNKYNENIRCLGSYVKLI